MYKDKNVVTFYTNALSDTPSNNIDMGSEYAVKCVRGLESLYRWTSDQSMHRKEFRVPSLIVAYNLMMNGVDRFDQIRATDPTQRREKRVSMSIFTFSLDLSLYNSFILKKI